MHLFKEISRKALIIHVCAPDVMLKNRPSIWIMKCNSTMWKCRKLLHSCSNICQYFSYRKILSRVCAILNFETVDWMHTMKEGYCVADNVFFLNPIWYKWSCTFRLFVMLEMKLYFEKSSAFLWSIGFDELCSLCIHSIGTLPLMQRIWAWLVWGNHDWSNVCNQNTVTGYKYCVDCNSSYTLCAFKQDSQPSD